MRLKYRKALTTRERRHRRVRAKVSGTTLRPRLNVFRSSAHIYAQVIDDTQSHTIVAASDLDEAVREKAGEGATSRHEPRQWAKSSPSAPRQPELMQ